LPDIISLRNGNSHCTIAPSVGGSLASWAMGDQHMLRPTANIGDPLEMASFPLVPYSNRIAEAHFDWEGEAFFLQPHKIAAPHAIHGVGWQRKWLTGSRFPNSVKLYLAHEGDSDWPWPFFAEQEITVGPDSLKLDLSIRNIADRNLPMGFGHHPYFDSAGASLQFDADSFYSASKDGLPVKPEQQTSATSFGDGKKIRDSHFDNLYGRWSGTARIEWVDREYALEIDSDLPHAVVYTPADEGYFCFEPVPHINNALNRADGDMAIIAPGDRYTASITFRAVPA
jgi:aldose 1-epimerase